MIQVSYFQEESQTPAITIDYPELSEAVIAAENSEIDNLKRVVLFNSESDSLLEGEVKKSGYIDWKRVPIKNTGGLHG